MPANLLLAALVAMAATLPSPAPAQSTPIAAPAVEAADVVHGREDFAARLTIPVRLGKNGPYRFMVDTGSQNTVLAGQIATELALPYERDDRVLGIAGSVSVKTVFVEELHFGRQRVPSLFTPLLDRTHIGADGILGLDSLQGQRVLFDFSRNIMAVGKVGERDGDVSTDVGTDKGFEIVVRARRRSGQLIITSALIDDVPVDVVIDTGAENTIGNAALARALGVKGGTPTMLSSVTGQSIPATMVAGHSFTVQQAKISNVLIAFTDTTTFAALSLQRKPAILLGMRELRTFKRVAIDFGKRNILFDLPPEAGQMPGIPAYGTG